MNKEMVLGFVRHALTAAGGSLVTKGLASQDELAGAIGAIITLAGFAWSIWAKRPRGDGGSRALMLLLAVGVMVSGCAGRSQSLVTSAATSEPTPVSAIADVLEVAGYTGTGIHLADHPKDAWKFERAVTALQGLENARNFSPVAFVRVMQDLGVRNLGGEKAQIIIGSTILVYDLRFRRLTPLEQPAFIHEAIAGAKRGIARALAERPKPKAFLQLRQSFQEGTEMRMMFLQKDMKAPQGSQSAPRCLCCPL